MPTHLKDTSSYDQSHIWKRTYYISVIMALANIYLIFVPLIGIYWILPPNSKIALTAWLMVVLVALGVGLSFLMILLSAPFLHIRPVAVATLTVAIVDLALAGVGAYFQQKHVESGFTLASLISPKHNEKAFYILGIAVPLLYLSQVIGFTACAYMICRGITRRKVDAITDGNALGESKRKGGKAESSVIILDSPPAPKNYRMKSPLMENAYYPEHTTRTLSLNRNTKKTKKILVVENHTVSSPKSAALPNKRGETSEISKERGQSHAQRTPKNSPVIVTMKPSLSSTSLESDDKSCPMEFRAGGPKTPEDCVKIKNSGLGTPNASPTETLDHDPPTPSAPSSSESKKLLSRIQTSTLDDSAASHDRNWEDISATSSDSGTQTFSQGVILPGTFVYPH